MSASLGLPEGIYLNTLERVPMPMRACAGGSLILFTKREIAERNAVPRK